MRDDETLTWTVISFGRNVVPRSTTRCNRRCPFSSRNIGTLIFSLEGVSGPPAAGLLDGDRECVDPHAEWDGLWIACNNSDDATDSSRDAFTHEWRIPQRRKLPSTAARFKRNFVNCTTACLSLPLIVAFRAGNPTSVDTFFHSFNYKNRFYICLELYVLCRTAN